MPTRVERTSASSTPSYIHARDMGVLDSSAEYTQVILRQPTKTGGKCFGAENIVTIRVDGNYTIDPTSLVEGLNVFVILSDSVANIFLPSEENFPLDKTTIEIQNESIYSVYVYSGLEVI